MLQITSVPTLHVRYEGESADIPLSEIDLGDLSTDAQIREAAARHLNAPLAKLAGFVVDKNTETGDITLRPQAVFG
jgi:hypothetical protein